MSRLKIDEYSAKCESGKEKFGLYAEQVHFRDFHVEEIEISYRLGSDRRTSTIHWTGKFEIEQLLLSV